MALGEIYFWTATINKWQLILQDKIYKEVILSSLNYLSTKELIDVYAFVIMPNHVHFIWKMNMYNGKESPVGSFLKFTAHTFKKLLKKESFNQLNNYRVDATNKSFEFWKRDPLAIHLYTPRVAYQKLNYLHANPLQERWNLVSDPCDYQYSSMKFYEQGIREFDFIKDLREVFG